MFYRNLEMYAMLTNVFKRLIENVDEEYSEIANKVKITFDEIFDQFLFCKVDE